MEAREHMAKQSVHGANEDKLTILELMGEGSVRAHACQSGKARPG